MHVQQSAHLQQRYRADCCMLHVHEHEHEHVHVHVHVQSAHLQQRRRYRAVRLLKLIKQHHRVGPPPHRLRQLATLLPTWPYVRCKM